MTTSTSAEPIGGTADRIKDLSVILNGARHKRLLSYNGLEEGRFPSAVCTNEGHYGTFINAHGDVLEGIYAAIAHIYAIDLQKSLFGNRSHQKSSSSSSVPR